MKKIVFLTISMVLFFSVMCSANGETDFYGGVSYNTFENVKDYGTAYDDSGIGIYGGMQWWQNSNYASGIELEYLETNGSISDGVNTIDAEISTIGILGTSTFELNQNTNLFLGAGLYRTTNSAEASNGVSVEESDSDFGFKLGIKSNYNLNYNTNFNSRISYRLAEVEVEGYEIDMSGFEVGFSLERKF